MLDAADRIVDNLFGSETEEHERIGLGSRGSSSEPIQRSPLLTFLISGNIYRTETDNPRFVQQTGYTLLIFGDT